MIAVHLSVMRCFFDLSSVFSGWSVFIGINPSFDRGCLLASEGVCSHSHNLVECVLTYKFLQPKACILPCSITLHAKENISFVKASSLRLLRKCNSRKGQRTTLYFTVVLLFVTLAFLYFWVAPEIRKPIIQNPALQNEASVSLTLFLLFSCSIHRFL